ncbi:MAG TPA: DsbC family protein [Burkholderiales bacterium]|nr:DsbC family protein [Burkholderiales bacterium]
MSSRLVASSLLLIGLIAGTVSASEAVRKGVQARFPDMAIESVQKTPFSGLYEVVVGGRILYTDEKVSYIFIGNLIDARGAAERDLTRERNAQLAVQTLRKASDQAIKRVRGNGKRVIYTFEDPNCGYCKQLQKELAKISDVTIYTFLWPILSQDSVDKSRAIWCAKDRAKAWDDVMLRGAAAQGDGNCVVPFEKNHELTQRFGIRGTPAIFLADGRMLGGYVPAAELEKEMSSAASAK